MGTDYMSIDEVAERVGLSWRTIWSRINDGSLPAIKMGRKWRIHRDDYAAWIAIQAA